MEDLNDKQFVKKLRAGDASALHSFYLALSPKIVSFLIRTMGMSGPDAEEVTNDALLKVHKGVAKFDPNRGVKLTTWIFEIAKNAAIDHYRKVRRQEGKDPKVETSDPDQEFIAVRKGKPKEPVTDPPKIGGEVEEVLPTRDSAAWRAYESLNEKEKDILRMRHVMSYEEIAEVEVTSVNAVSTRHFRTLKKLKELKAAYEKEKANER